MARGPPGASKIARRRAAVAASERPAAGLADPAAAAAQCGTAGHPSAQSLATAGPCRRGPASAPLR
eukprot:15459373-Alexandrium_andersonii.AAC.1